MYYAIAVAGGVIIEEREFAWSDGVVDTEHDAQWWRDYHEALREFDAATPKTGLTKNTSDV
jgi:hypothetical protein